MFEIIGVNRWYALRKKDAIDRYDKQLLATENLA